MQPFIPLLCIETSLYGDQDYLIPLKELKPMLDLGDDALGDGCRMLLDAVACFPVQV